MLDKSHGYLNALRLLWIEDANPLWPIAAIASSYQNQHTLPNWVMEYLGPCAERMLAPESAKGDFARNMPRIFGFSPKAGPRHQLRAAKRMLHNEEFAMKFARHILLGKEPSDARADAANELEGEWKETDDKVLQKAAREHFRPECSPRKTVHWQAIVIIWLIQNPLYQIRYPYLPRLDALIPQMEAISRDPSVKGWLNGDFIGGSSTNGGHSCPSATHAQTVNQPGA